MKFSVKAGLALAVSAAFVATSVAPAFAASQVDFSGFYRAQFYTYGNHNFNRDDDGDFTTTKKSSSDFFNRFRLNMDVQATDEVSIHARWQGPDTKKWGQHDGGNDSVNVKYAYGKVKQDWGTTFVGYMPDNQFLGHAGLWNLGWDPLSVDGDDSNYRPFDTGNGGDGIAFTNTWDNGFTLNLSYAKMKSEDDNLWSEIGSDNDFDRFQVEGIYQWDTGGASLTVAYDRDASGWCGASTDTAAYEKDYTHWVGDGQNGTAPQQTDSKYQNAGRDYSTASVWYINPAFAQSWGAFSTHAEAMFGFGKYNNFTKTKADGSKADDKISGQGFYIDFDYNYGPGRVNLAGWWASGNEAGDEAKGTKMKALPDGIGQGHNPLLVLYGGGGLDAANDQQYDSFGGYKSSRANHWAIDLNGQHAFTDEITARWAIAYAALNKANYTKENGGFDQGKDLGWEADFGIEAEILDNLHLYSGFGYLFAGDAFKTAETDDPDDGYAFINSLYFNF